MGFHRRRAFAPGSYQGLQTTPAGSVAALLGQMGP